MRCLFVLFLITACSESHIVGDFDSGFSEDAGQRFDASGFDSPRFDAPRFDVPRFDAPPARDAGGPDTEIVFVDAGSDTAPSFDVFDECRQLCVRAEMCVPDTELGDCLSGCLDIEDLTRDPLCRLLAYNLFRCAEAVPCEELERAFDGGACTDAVQEFGESCGER